MAEFNLRCQMRYPKRCDLPITEKERLEGPEKYKAFLMYQFEDNDAYLKDTIREYFKSPICFVYDAEDIRSLGVKFCKICKLAQACDFGIAVLSPENENVFMEVGLLIGMGKPCLYIVNEDKLRQKDIKKLPFDISDQIIVKYNSKVKLISELEKEVPHFIQKVVLLSGYEKAMRDNLKNRLEQLTPEAKNVLKIFISFGEVELSRKEYDKILRQCVATGTVIDELQEMKLVNGEYSAIHGETYLIEKAYRTTLQELLFSD
jgi:hypothetical protein